MFRPKKNLRLLAIAAVVVCAVIMGILAIGLLSGSLGQSSWLFKGAYAKYSGNAEVFLVKFDFTIREEVVDWNSTHAQLLNTVSIDSSLSEPTENTQIVWVDLSKNQYIIENTSLINKYEATNLYIEGVGTRNCVVYEYATEDGGPTMTIYVDRTIGWPLKMKMSITGENSLSLELDINLVETNIKGLR